jgi:orotidine-5'-phosphate decarboxylase
VTARVPFIEQLERRWVEGDTMLCIGLDPDPARLPDQLAGHDQPLFQFCADIAAATADLVCAFKPQIAYFAAHGAEAQLARLIAHLHANHPNVPVILDAKRGDIGATARLYAQEAFERYDADGGVFLLCRTSNQDSAWLQNYPPDQPVFLRVASATRSWNRYGNLMLVAGATYAEDLRRIREAAGNLALLVPGIGAQGGDLAAVLAAGLNDQGRGLVINASRSVLYADSGDTFAHAARAAAAALRDEIRGLRAGLLTSCPTN